MNSVATRGTSLKQLLGNRQENGINSSYPHKLSFHQNPQLVFGLNGVSRHEPRSLKSRGSVNMRCLVFRVCEHHHHGSDGRIDCNDDLIPGILIGIGECRLRPA